MSHLDVRTRPPRIAANAQSAALPLPPVPTLDPLHALTVHQQGRCGSCNRPLGATRRTARDLDGRRIAAVVCPTCSNQRAAVRQPSPVTTAGPLLRLRLTQGPFGARRQITDADVQALIHGRWDHFANPVDALWVWQGGTCLLHQGAITACSSAVLDHDHSTPGLVRGLLCGSCNAAEGKRGQRLDAERLADYRKHPPAQQFTATRGLTYQYLTTWDRERYNRARLTA